MLEKHLIDVQRIWTITFIIFEFSLWSSVIGLKWEGALDLFLEEVEPEGIIGNFDMAYWPDDAADKGQDLTSPSYQLPPSTNDIVKCSTGRGGGEGWSQLSAPRVMAGFNSEGCE